MYVPATSRCSDGAGMDGRRHCGGIRARTDSRFAVARSCQGCFGDASVMVGDEEKNGRGKLVRRTSQG